MCSARRHPVHRARCSRPPCSAARRSRRCFAASARRWRRAGRRRRRAAARRGTPAAPRRRAPASFLAVSTANAAPDEWPHRHDPGQATPVISATTCSTICARGRERLARRRPGRDRAARRRRPPARCRAARWPSAGSSPRCRRRRGSTPGHRAWRVSPRFRQRLQQPGRRWVRPSSSAARSARTGWRVTSLSDTARSRAIASFTADSEVPPQSKKWSCRPIWSCGMPSTFAQAAASRRSVGVRGAS